MISLIDHKSDVDYNVAMQLLKYMACIWAEYEKTFLSERGKISKNNVWTDDNEQSFQIIKKHQLAIICSAPCARTVSRRLHNGPHFLSRTTSRRMVVLNCRTTQLDQSDLRDRK